MSEDSLNEPIEQWSTRTARAIAYLRQTRTQWHEVHGVPISLEYALFMEAIGQVEDMLAKTIT